MKILVIGAGGVGTRLIPLAHKLFGDHTLIVMDGDKFTTSNLARQVMTRADVGTNKAVAMSKKYEGVLAEPHFLTEPEQLELAEFVVCIPDNHKCRIVALAAADKYGFPMVLAGNEEFTANAMYYHRKYQGSSVDPRVRYPEMMMDVERTDTETCLEKVDTKPQTGLANSFAADFALALTHYWLGDLPDDAILEQYAPFEMLWSRTAVDTIRGVSDA